MSAGKPPWTPITEQEIGKTCLVGLDRHRAVLLQEHVVITVPVDGDPAERRQVQNGDAGSAEIVALAVDEAHRHSREPFGERRAWCRATLRRRVPPAKQPAKGGEQREQAK
jgi:hypothetical protein